MRSARIIAFGSGSGIVAGLLGAALHPLAPVALAAAVPIGLAALLHPGLGLLLTVSAIPLEGLGRLTSGTSTVVVSVAKLFGLATLCAWAASVGLGLRGWRVPREMLPLALFWSIGAATLLHTSDPGNGLARTVSFLSTFLFVLCIVNLIDGTRFLRAVVIGLLATTAAVGLFSLAIYFNPAFVTENMDDTAVDAIGSQADHSEASTLGEEVLRAGGATGSPHVYAANLLVAIPLYLYLIRSDRSPAMLRLAAIGGLLLAIANLLLTHTRSALVAFAPILVLLAIRGLVRIRPGLLLAAPVAGAALLFLLPESVSTRLFGAERYSVDGAATLATRLDYWTAGLEMLQQNWLFGMGLGNFSDLARYEPSTTPGHAFMHNIYLQLFNEVGIFGFAAILCFLTMAFLNFETSLRRFRAAGDRDAALLTVALEGAFLSGIVLGFTMDYLHFAVKDWWFVAAASIVLRLVPTPRAGPG